MDFEQIIYEPGKVARIIFNRPKYLPVGRAHAEVGRFQIGYRRRDC
jgi:hypothetical protein